ncbi:hypothetical protein KSP39_PZI023725 [Platanthera zijinensis]|uniref:Uncharacterized protein n=1 Tax=Platanthera zijinensis TaxID=2320716 RepID=A0AAP0FU23_9ASPA
MKNSWESDTHPRQVIAAKEMNEEHPKYSWRQGVLKTKGKLVINKDPPLRNRLMETYHLGPIGGSFGNYGHVQTHEKSLLLEGNEVGDLRVHPTLHSLPTMQNGQLTPYGITTTATDFGNFLARGVHGFHRWSSE